jgi:hypothetical protein
MMIVTIHQPEHLPWLGFFDKMRQADIFVLLDTVQFSKGDFQNRNRIKTAQGATWLTVPVYKKGRSHQRIVDVEIVQQTKWRRRCCGLLTDNYAAAPYFARHQPFFEWLYARDWQYLAELNIRIIRYLVEQLGLETKLLRASQMGVDQAGATAVLVNICSALGADVYLSGKHGREYLDESSFARQGIQIVYQDFHHPIYPQQGEGFVANLSVIDLLFNCGDTSLCRIAAENDSIVERSRIGAY